MNAMPENYPYEEAFWSLVRLASQKIFKADWKEISELKEEILALPWAERKFFYNTEPLYVVADFFGYSVSAEHEQRYRVHADTMIRAANRHIEDQKFLADSGVDLVMRMSDTGSGEEDIDFKRLVVVQVKSGGALTQAKIKETITEADRRIRDVINPSEKKTEIKKGWSLREIVTNKYTVEKNDLWQDYKAFELKAAKGKKMKMFIIERSSEAAPARKYVGGYEYITKIGEKTVEDNGRTATARRTRTTSRD